MESSFLQTKIAGVPLVVLVGGIAGAFALFLGLRSKTPKSSTSVDMLSPSAAEAFGTLQQQQQDVGNALSVLGMNQSNILQGEQALGSGIIGSQHMTSGVVNQLEAAMGAYTGFLTPDQVTQANQAGVSEWQLAHNLIEGNMQQGLGTNTLATPLQPTSSAQTVSAFV